MASKPAAVHVAHAQVKPKVFSFSWKKMLPSFRCHEENMMAIYIYIYIISIISPCFTPDFNASEKNGMEFQVLTFYRVGMGYLSLPVGWLGLDFGQILVVQFTSFQPKKFIFPAKKVTIKWNQYQYMFLFIFHFGVFSIISRIFCMLMTLHIKYK